MYVQKWRKVSAHIYVRRLPYQAAGRGCLRCGPLFRGMLQGPQYSSKRSCTECDMFCLCQASYPGSIPPSVKYASEGDLQPSKDRENFGVTIRLTLANGFVVHGARTLKGSSYGISVWCQSMTSSCCILSAVFSVW
nr:hypothetical protein CFP56_72348 [Quercus suber]